MKLVAIGASYGGLYALMDILGALTTDFPCPVAVVQHRSAAEHDEDRLGLVLSRYSSLPVHDADHGQVPEPSRVYLAPSDYHLMIDEGHFELTVDDQVHYSRPAIDVLFESAARAYGPDVVGVLLTGYGHDGTSGMEAIREAGGVTIAEDPETALQPAMPRSAIEAGAAAEVLKLDAIAPRLIELCRVAA
ncbi:MAG TPA: chemotaxis protein CheB [Thermoleophilaceae bacterium]|nr:chemotaxis protein CheB [Thermoleophilaceae bacterium]